MKLCNLALISPDPAYPPRGIYRNGVSPREGISTSLRTAAALCDFSTAPRLCRPQQHAFKGAARLVLRVLLIRGSGGPR